MSLVARRYNVNANLVFSWWRQYPEEVHDAGTGRFVVVLVQATVEGEADTVTTVSCARGWCCGRRRAGWRSRRRTLG